MTRVAELQSARQLFIHFSAKLSYRLVKGLSPVTEITCPAETTFPFNSNNFLHIISLYFVSSSRTTRVTDDMSL